MNKFLNLFASFICLSCSMALVLLGIYLVSILGICISVVGIAGILASIAYFAYALKLP